VKVVYSLLQSVWSRDYGGFYALVEKVERGDVLIEPPIRWIIVDLKGMFAVCWGEGNLVVWQRRTLTLLMKAYRNISPAKAARYLGTSVDDVVSSRIP
jgi:hypothetical protein